MVCCRNAQGDGKRSNASVCSWSSRFRQNYARLLVSEKNLDLVFSGTTGTASSLYKAETINSLLHMGQNVEDFQESQKRISAQMKSEILFKFGDARILVIDEVSMLSPVMLAFINLRPTGATAVF